MASVPPIPQDPDDLPVKGPPTVDQLWVQFEAMFPSESASVEALYNRAQELGIIRCRSCKGSDFQKEHGVREVTCTNCGKTKWFTAGTFFDGVRHVRAWLAAIWIKENGAILTSAKLHRLLGIAYSSAWCILKKINTVLLEEMQEGHDVASTFFSITYYKRSRETPAREHPVAEQEELEKLIFDDSKIASNTPGDGKFDNTEKAARFIFADNVKEKSPDADSFTTGDVRKLDLPEKMVYDLLSAKPVPIATLFRTAGMSTNKLSAALTILQVTGLVTCLPGEKYIRSPDKRPRAYQDMMHQSSVGSQHAAEIKGMIDGFIDFIRIDYHGISRKYVQNYLAAYWCYKDRSRWLAGALLNACLKFRPISGKEIRAYVSPISLKLLPLRL